MTCLRVDFSLFHFHHCEIDRQRQNSVLVRWLTIFVPFYAFLHFRDLRQASARGDPHQPGGCVLALATHTLA